MKTENGRLAHRFYAEALQKMQHLEAELARAKKDALIFGKAIVQAELGIREGDAVVSDGESFVVEEVQFFGIENKEPSCLFIVTDGESSFYKYKNEIEKK